MWSPEEIADAKLDDFKVFLRIVWNHLGLPAPTPVQLEIADFLQHGGTRICVEALRGVGKSWITTCFAVWNLFIDPQKKILVVSASQGYADKIATFAKRLIDEMEILEFLRPDPYKNHRHAAIAFDVGPAGPSPSPSMSSAGLGGQITGNRADIIIPDDVEVPKNSFTHLLREKLREQTKEFSAILKKDNPNARICYLGTPHNEDTLYNYLPERGYEVRIWTAQVPDNPEIYHGRLAPSIVKMIEDGVKVGTPLEPSRFPMSVLRGEMAEHGTSGYARQFMLNPTPADMERFPLKCRDLIVDNLDDLRAPIRYVWAAERDLTLENLRCGGLESDLWRKPALKSDEQMEFQGTVMAIDPSGKGKDETGYAIVRYSQGLLYWVGSGGFQDGFDEKTLGALADTAIRFGVTHVAPEPNYGGGMFGQLLKPVLFEHAELARRSPERMAQGVVTPQLVEDLPWSTGQKESRILDVLEPLVQNHKLVVARTVIERDYRVQEERQKYSVIYQMTRLTRDKGCLAHDDRIESLAMACNFWVDRMARNQEKQVQMYRERQLDIDLKRHIEICQQGGVVYTNHTIGKGGRVPRKTVHQPINSPFSLRKPFRGLRQR